MSVQTTYPEAGDAVTRHHRRVADMLTSLKAEANHASPGSDSAERMFADAVPLEVAAVLRELVDVAASFGASAAIERAREVAEVIEAEHLLDLSAVGGGVAGDAGESSPSRPS